MEVCSDGIVLIDKNEGVTSSHVVRQVKRFLMIKKIGHAGTLDPFATGLLIVLLGQGTKLSSFIMASEKTYLATVRLGIETDTLDSTGRVIRTSPVPEIGSEDILKTVQTFTGSVEQTPPAFSALRYRGRRAYEWARRGIEVKLGKRHVNIESILITDVSLPDITMEVRCSKGTYMRSLASDLGERLGPGGHLATLRRLSSGPYKVDEAIKSEEVGRDGNRSDALGKIISLGDALPQMEGTQVDCHMAGKIRNGYRPHWAELDWKGLIRRPCDHPIKLISGTELVAIVNGPDDPEKNNDRVRIMRVFN